jgi:hypothetical protein
MNRGVIRLVVDGDDRYYPDCMNMTSCQQTYIFDWRRLLPVRLKITRENIH